MHPQQLHIVTHDIPWPAGHGGFIDLFYKIKALHAIGVHIHLHCFHTNRQAQPELEKYCVRVHYYRRRKSISRFSFRVPFIVNSRVSDELISTLQKDNYPVLLEGIHCTYPLFKDLLGNRKVLVRLHNAEFEYYHQLAQHERNPFKRFYFRHESKLLKRYEQALAAKASFLAVSEQDVAMYREQFNAADISYLPVFIPDTWAPASPGKGCFCLYHGNLSVNENEVAASWLLREIFAKTDLPLVIAGKDPSKKLEQLAHEQLSTCITANLPNRDMQDLVAKAHVHVLPAFNNTGIKLKLLNAIFNGRHCLVNSAAVKGSGLEAYCHIADDATSFLQQLTTLYATEFSAAESERREELKKTVFNNEENAKRLMQALQ